MSELAILFCILCALGTKSDTEDTAKNKVLRAMVIIVGILTVIVTIYNVGVIILNY